MNAEEFKLELDAQIEDLGLEEVLRILIHVCKTKAQQIQNEEQESSIDGDFLERDAELLEAKLAEVGLI